jgi:hypothetical protein
MTPIVNQSQEMIPTVAQSQETQEMMNFAFYLSTLPPVEQWVETRQLLPPEVAVNTQLMWRWTGRSLEAFFSDMSNPLPGSGLDEALQQLIEWKSSHYRILASLFFEAEHLIREEAKKLSIDPSFDLRFPRRSDLIKMWALEECRHGILISRQKFWESHSKKEISDRLKAIKEHHNGKIKKEEMQSLLSEWRDKDTNLQQSLDIETIRPWSYFFAEIFEKYATELPSFHAFATHSSSTKGFRKFFLVEGQYQEYSGRKADKQKRKTRNRKLLKNLLTKP